MAALQPETKRMLGIMLREIEQTIMPELGSTHAKTVAHLIGQGLRNLITREEALPLLLDNWNRIEADLMDKAGQPLNAALLQDRVAYNHALTNGIESLVVTRMSQAGDGTVDAVCKSAIEAESRFFVEHARAIAAVQVPQRGAERKSLLDVTPARLTEYLARNLPHLKNLQVTTITPILSGFSKLTLLVDMEVDGIPMPMVLRRDLPDGSTGSTVVDEYPVVAALHRLGLPVPEPVLLEADASVFGEPFTVTRRAAGTVVSNPIGGIVSGPEQINAARELAAFLARLHRFNIRDLGLPEHFCNASLSTSDYLGKQIDICENHYRTHRLQPSPTFAAAIAWLRANVPVVAEAPRLIHGDAGLNNMLMDGNRIGVMLDWELAHPGDAGEDVAYTRGWVDQIMPWEEFLAHYYKHGGPEYHSEREKFYAMLSDVRVGVFTVRIRNMLRTSDHPELSLMYGAQHYYGYFIENIAKNLLAG